jgi:hypothetical protein
MGKYLPKHRAKNTNGMGVEKQRVPRVGKYLFRRGGGDIVFGPKYRPLPKHYSYKSFTSILP